MSFRYAGAGRDQLFLMPVDMRDWLPEGHLAWFLVDVVANLDTSALHDAHANDGAGRPAYDPDVLLALLLYAYCTGVRSSRKIEQACQVDIAFRVICANQVPDHTTISRFRQAHDRHAQDLFVQALALCARAGLAKVGVVAVDGTKMAADASMAANAAWAQVNAQVEALFSDAARVDAEEGRLFGDDRGDELPGELARRGPRAARLQLARQELEKAKAAQQRRLSEAAGRADMAQAEAARTGRGPRGRPPAGREVQWAQASLERAEAKARARREAAEERAGAPGAHRPKAVEDYARVKRAKQRLQKAMAASAVPSRWDLQPSRFGEPKVNLTDPQARVMKSRSGYLVGYNAQAAVGQGGVVLAAEVCQQASDVTQALPMLAALGSNLARAGIAQELGTVLFDAGYWSEANATAPGPPRLIGTANVAKLREKARLEGFRSGPPPTGARPVEAMEHVLCTKEGSELYAKRSTTVEPVFARHKHVRGYRRMARRGLVAASAEWKLINTTHNLLKLFQASPLLLQA